MERIPDFEDDKVRMWRQPLPGSNPQEDPTVLRVQVELGEEPFESRTYLVRPTADIVEELAQMVVNASQENGYAPRPLLEGLAQEFVRSALLKFLAKRNTSPGEISFLIVGMVFGRRSLVRPLRTLSLEGYRTKVEDYEKEWVTGGPLELGTIVTAEDWIKYQHEQQ